MICLSGSDLSLGYDGTVLIGNLNFEINEGDYVCVIGENGIGKSTLIKTILKLKRPMGGKIQLFEGAKKGSIGYLPQQTQMQKDFPASVEEIVRSGYCSKMGLRPFFTKEEMKTAENNMKKMNILDLKHRCYRDLSGGQQQRTLLARALCATEKMLILDEPVAGLDPIATEEMYEIIERLNRDDKITIMMVTHDMENTMRYASHIFYLSGDGYFFGTKEEFLSYAEKNDIAVLTVAAKEEKK